MAAKSLSCCNVPVEKAAAVPLCAEASSFSWCTKSEVCFSHRWRQSKPTADWTNKQPWWFEFAARFFRGLKGCRYLVSRPGLPFEKCKGFFCKRFWTLLVLTVLVQAGNWTENFKSRLDKALQLRAEIQTAHESKPSVLAPANGFLPQWLTKGWGH